MDKVRAERIEFRKVNITILAVLTLLLFVSLNYAW